MVRCVTSVSNIDEHSWNMVDNVLLKGKIIDALDLPTIQIIEQTKNNTLVNLDKNKIFFSDHLPLLFKLNIQ